VILALQGHLNPYKKFFNNISELLYILNLKVMYVFSFYWNENTGRIVINIMVTMAALHFTLIIIHHIIMYGCKSRIKNKTLLKYDLLKIWKLKRYNKIDAVQSSMQNRKLQTCLSTNGYTSSQVEFMYPKVGLTDHFV